MGKTITVRADGALVIKFDHPDEHTAFLAALDLIEAGELRQRSVRNGGKATATQRTVARLRRDAEIRKLAATMTVRQLARRFACSEKTIRRALHQTALRQTGS